MKTSQELTDRLKEALGSNLKSVVLFGSAAADDQTKKISDYNVLVVVGEINLDTLKKLGSVKPAPLLFSEALIRQAGDVFPIEFLDIQSSRKILYGSDPFGALEIHTGNLRHQLEYELRGKLLQLRQRYTAVEGKPRDVQELIEKSFSSFAVLFKAALRLIGEEPAAKRAEAFSQLKKHVNIDVEALQQILDQRENKRPAGDTDELFSRLIKNIETVIDFVNNFKGKEKIR